MGLDCILHRALPRCQQCHASLKRKAIPTRLVRIDARDLAITAPMRLATA